MYVVSYYDNASYILLQSDKKLQAGFDKAYIHVVVWWRPIN